MNAGDWKADQWLLQVMNPKRYRETTRQEITGADGGPVKTETVAKVVLFPELEPVEAADPLAAEPGSTDAIPGKPGA